MYSTAANRISLAAVASHDNVEFQQRFYRISASSGRICLNPQWESDLGVLKTWGYQHPCGVWTVWIHPPPLWRGVHNYSSAFSPYSFCLARTDGQAELAWVQGVQARLESANGCPGIPPLLNLLTKTAGKYQSFIHGRQHCVTQADYMSHGVLLSVSQTERHVSQATFSCSPARPTPSNQVLFLVECSCLRVCPSVQILVRN